jgi:HD-GYP domain-containing protein (c-di-GMP phosphodiesterase class II)
MTFATDVNIGGSSAATIVAIATLNSVSQGVVGISQTKEEDLWSGGLPIVFVVNQSGETIFHPDPAVTADRKPMGDLKIVQEWLESGMQVQSALVPFSATFNGKTHEMIGAYSTAQLAEGYSVGVITMQDEARALASVGEMRDQTWLISMAFAVLALFVGFVGTRLMTSPLLRLVTAAKQIAAGDFSSRVETKNITEIGTLGETFNLMTDRIEEQIANLAKAAEENRELFVGTVKALAAAIDGKDKYTRGHSERVSRISVAIGKRMGMGEEELETLRMSSLLHDIGKIAIDDSILKKPAALTDEEFEIMKTHPQKGYKIMSQIPAMKEFLPGMYMHHEMVNGKGYPQGLTGDQIPLQAKIVSVADTFDAMTIDRPYSKGMDLPSALERLRSFVGTRYQSDVVEALVDACNDGEVANGIVRQMAAIRAAEAEAVKEEEEETTLLELVA